MKKYIMAIRLMNAGREYSMEIVAGLMPLIKIVLVLIAILLGAILIIGLISVGLIVIIWVNEWKDYKD